MKRVVDSKGLLTAFSAVQCLRSHGEAELHKLAIMAPRGEDRLAFAQLLLDDIRASIGEEASPISDPYLQEDVQYVTLYVTSAARVLMVATVSAFPAEEVIPRDAALDTVTWSLPVKCGGVAGWKPLQLTPTYLRLALEHAGNYRILESFDQALEGRIGAGYPVPDEVVPVAVPVPVQPVFAAPTFNPDACKDTVASAWATMSQFAEWFMAQEVLPFLPIACPQEFDTQALHLLHHYARHQWPMMRHLSAIDIIMDVSTTWPFTRPGKWGHGRAQCLARIVFVIFAGLWQFFLLPFILVREGVHNPLVWPSPRP